MQLKTKIILSWTLMLILAIGALGLRSISIIHQNLEEKSYVYLHSILSSYMSIPFNIIRNFWKVTASTQSPPM